MGRNLNEQRPILECLVDEIALEAVFVEAIHRTSHCQLASARHATNFFGQLQQLKTHIRNIKYDFLFFTSFQSFSRAI